MDNKTDKPVKIPAMKTEVAKKPDCGIIMPISEIDGCNSEHWKEVLQIIKDTITDAGLIPKLVSDADDIGIIQKRIVQNIYDNPMVVCDVSGKNPNVMFELGMRLAFDRPAIIIKDDKTDYSFDTSPIEHIGYPRDLHYHMINQFKRDLANKIQGTITASKNKSHSTFLKHFGKFSIAKLEEEEVTSNEYILHEIQDLSEKFTYLFRHSIVNPSTLTDRATKFFLRDEITTLIQKYAKENNYDSISHALIEDNEAELLKYLTNRLPSHMSKSEINRVFLEEMNKHKPPFD